LCLIESGVTVKAKEALFVRIKKEKEKKIRQRAVLPAVMGYLGGRDLVAVKCAGFQAVMGSPGKIAHGIKAKPRPED